MKRRTIPFLLLSIALIACSALPSSVSAIAQQLTTAEVHAYLKLRILMMPTAMKLIS